MKRGWFSDRTARRLGFPGAHASDFPLVRQSRTTFFPIRVSR